MKAYFYRDLDPNLPRESAIVVERSLAEVMKLEGEVSKEGDNMENNVYRVDKSMPSYGVVQKCLSAIAKADYSTITRGDIDLALQAIAEDVAKQEGVDFAAAYEATANGPTGRALYQMREEIPVNGTGRPVAKQDDAVSKSAEMERAAESFSKAYGVDLTEARRLVASYYAEQK